ncbi:MAG: flavin reductase family protein [Caulobacteraceae bacterium]
MSSSLVFPRPAVDRQAFDDAVARLAGAVAIVTWWDEAPRGLLVRAVNLLSTRPPRVLFGVDKDDFGHETLLRTDACALNLLSDADEAEAQRFAQAGPPDRFSPDRWRLSPDQPPRIAAGAVYLSGGIDQKIDAGSHSLFVVRVETAEIKNRAPLVYFDRGFRRLAQSPPSAGAQVIDLSTGSPR